MSTPTAAQPCPGDLDGDGQVTISELVRAVNAALAGCEAGQPCPGDVNGDGQVTIDELVRGVNAALVGCDGAPITVAPTATPTATPMAGTPSRTPGGAQHTFRYEFLPGSLYRASDVFLAEVNAQGARGFAYRGDWLFGSDFSESGALYVKDESQHATFRFEFIPASLHRPSSEFLAEVNAQGARGFAYRGDSVFGSDLSESGALYVKDESQRATFRYEFLPGSIYRSSSAFLAEANAQGARGFAYRGDWLFGDALEESGALYVKDESLVAPFHFEFIPGPLDRSSSAFLAEANAQGARGFLYRGDWLFGADLAERGALYVDRPYAWGSL
ncbi:hypothetical protein KF840_09250 [bacterium]|nr:hypothetical protein [bacterium]